MEYMVHEQFPQQHFLTRFFRSCLGELGVDTESLGLFMKMQKKKPTSLMRLMRKFILSLIWSRKKLVPEAWTRSFGVPFYLRERSIHELENQSEQDWKLYIEGQLFSTGRPLNMTSYEELRQYIRQELSAAPVKEG